MINKNLFSKYMPGVSHMPLFFLAVLFLFCFSFDLSSQYPNTIAPPASVVDHIQVATTPFYIFEDGEFRESTLTKEPELIGGKDLMETLIRLNIRYPDVAKEKKIGGTVY